MASIEAENVLHRIKPRLLAGQPLRRRDRAAREHAPAGCAMRQLDHLAIGRKDGAMLAGIVAAAQRREADIAAPARPRDAVAYALAFRGEIDTAARGRRLAERQRRARRRVDFVAMMHLENLDIVILAEAPRRLLDESEQPIDAETHI